MSYKDLQERAKELGLPYVGVSAQDLKSSIKAKENSGSTPDASGPVPPTDSSEETPTSGVQGDTGARGDTGLIPPADQPTVTSDTPKEQEKKGKISKEPEVKEEATAALVMNGAKEVRRYTLEGHGENFAELAEKYAAPRKHTVVLKTLKPGIVCPSCGYVIPQG